MQSAGLWRPVSPSFTQFNFPIHTKNTKAFLLATGAWQHSLLLRQQALLEKKAVGHAACFPCCSPVEATLKIGTASGTLLCTNDKDKARCPGAGFY